MTTETEIGIALIIKSPLFEMGVGGLGDDRCIIFDRGVVLPQPVK